MTENLDLLTMLELALKDLGDKQDILTMTKMLAIYLKEHGDKYLLTEEK